MQHVEVFKKVKVPINVNILRIKIILLKISHGILQILKIFINQENKNKLETGIKTLEAKMNEKKGDLTNKLAQAEERKK